MTSLVIGPPAKDFRSTKTSKQPFVLTSYGELVYVSMHLLAYAVTSAETV